MLKTVFALALIASVAVALPPVRGTKVSQLPTAALPFDGTEVVMIVQDGQNRQVPMTALRDYFSQH